MSYISKTYGAFISTVQVLASVLLLATAFMLNISTVPAADKSPVDLFTDESDKSGLVFHHFNGMSGNLFFPEVVGTGAALFDYDNDGDLDVYIVQGTMLGPDKTLEDAIYPPKHTPPFSDRLYRNDSVINGDSVVLRFTDITAQSGELGNGYGMGVASGDINNDGWPDLYVSNFGSNQMLLNLGNGKFRDITEESGTGDDRWNTSSSFFDYDNDGLLDLFTGSYVDFTWDNRKPCFTAAAVPEYCGPLTYSGTSDRLYRNTGNNRFEDVTERAGINESDGGALGVISADFNADGWMDIYVANDGVPNHLWLNQGDGTFIDEAMLAGAALNMDGSAEASMGVDAADFDGDGDEDLFMTHLARETNTLYINDGSGWFEDQTVSMGLSKTSFSFTGFGTAWIDFDNDGWLDILSANGAVTQMEEQVRAHDPYPMHQTNQVFRNLGDGRYEDFTTRAGSVFELSEVSRGTTFGDVDNDGDIDALIINNNGQARLLINNIRNDNKWIGLRLLDKNGKRDQLGAFVEVKIDDKRSLWRRVRTDGSYVSARDPRLLVGLGMAPDSVSLIVAWPNGSRDSWTGLATGTYHILKQGDGKVVNE